MPVLTGIPADDLRTLEDVFADRVLRLFRDLVRAAAGGVGATLTAASSPAAASVDDLASIPARWSEHVDGELLEYVGEVYRGGAGHIGLDVLEALPEGVVYDLPPVSDEAALSYLRERRNFLVGVGDDLWVEARAELVEGMRLGESVPQLRERVIAVGIEGEARADRVARTEVNGAANAGAYDQVLALGVEAEKEWVDTSDSRTRASHAAVGGTRVGVRETFLVGGHPMLRPHDGPAGEVVNCRCTLAFHVTDEALAALVTDEAALTAAGDPADGAMIALLPDERTLLHLPRNPDGPGWLAPEDLHLTLLFLGDAAAWDRVARNDVIDHVRATLRESPVAGPVAGDAFATAHFNPDGENPCWVLLVGSCPDVVDLRGHLEEVFLDGDPSKTIPEQRVPYVPHITLRYSDSDEEAGRVREYLGHVTFDRVRVSFGTDVTDIPLGDPATVPPEEE